MNWCYYNLQYFFFTFLKRIMEHLHKKTDKHNPSHHTISQVMNLIRETVTRRYFV